MEKNTIKDYRVTPFLSIITILLGLLFISVPIALQLQEPLSSILAHIGYVFLPTGAITLLYDRYLLGVYTKRLGMDLVEAMKPHANGEITRMGEAIQEIAEGTKLLGSALELGFRMVYRERSEINYAKLLSNAHSHVDILGLSLGTFARQIQEDEVRNSIEGALRRGCKFRFLLVDPKSEQVQIRENQEGRVKGAIKIDIEGAIKDIEGLMKKEEREYRTICLRKSSFTPTYSLLRVDNRLFIQPYPCGGAGWRFPTFELEDKLGSVFRYYTEDFNQFWEHSEPQEVENRGANLGEIEGQDRAR
ncbi:MAG: hypothetical protein AB1414_20720 [bacterium]